MLGRRKAAAISRHSVSVEVPLPDLLSSAPAADQAAARSFIVSEVIKFLIVNRGLARATVDELQKAVQAYREQQQVRSGRRARGASSVRRAEQMLTAFQSVTSSLGMQLASLQHNSMAVHTVAVMLGPTPGRARELYTIRFADASSHAMGKAGRPAATAAPGQQQGHGMAPCSTTTAAAAARQGHGMAPCNTITAAAAARQVAASRQLVRSLLQQYDNIPGWTNTLPPCTKVHVLLHAPHPAPATPLAGLSPEEPLGMHQDDDDDDGDVAMEDADGLDPLLLPLPHQPLATAAAAHHLADPTLATGAASAAQRTPARSKPATFAPRPHLTRVLDPNTCPVGLQVEFIISCRPPAQATAGRDHAVGMSRPHQAAAAAWPYSGPPSPAAAWGNSPVDGVYAGAAGAAQQPRQSDPDSWPSQVTQLSYATAALSMRNSGGEDEPGSPRRGQGPKSTAGIPLQQQLFSPPSVQRHVGHEAGSVLRAGAASGLGAGSAHRAGAPSGFGADGVQRVDAPAGGFGAVSGRVGGGGMGLAAAARAAGDDTKSHMCMAVIPATPPPQPSRRAGKAPHSQQCERARTACGDCGLSRSLLQWKARVVPSWALGMCGGPWMCTMMCSWVRRTRWRGQHSQQQQTGCGGSAAS